MSLPRPPDLEASTVRAAVQEALPGHEILNSTTCYHIREGADHYVWSVGNGLILRALPETGRANGKSEASLRRDAAVTSLLSESLGDDVSGKIPCVLATFSIGGWICNVEQKLSGKSLESVAPTEQTVTDMGSFLHSLTTVDVDRAMAATEYEEPRPNLRTRTTRAIQAWQDLTKQAYVHDPDRVIPKLLDKTHAHAAKLDKQSVAPYRSALIHGDLHGEHIFVDEHTGALQGIIDWSDALVGDPCRDLAGTCLAVGRDMARRIGVEAGHSEVTIERGLLYAMCLAIRDLRDRICQGLDDVPEELLKSQFRKVFQGSGAENILNK